MKARKLLALVNDFSNYIRYYAFILEKNQVSDPKGKFQAKALPNFDHPDWEQKIDAFSDELTNLYLNKHNSDAIAALKIICCYQVLKALKVILSSATDASKNLEIDAELLTMCEKMRDQLATHGDTENDKVSIFYELNTHVIELESFLNLAAKDSDIANLPNWQQNCQQYFVKKKFQEKIARAYKPNDSFKAFVNKTAHLTTNESLFLELDTPQEIKSYYSHRILEDTVNAILILNPTFTSEELIDEIKRNPHLVEHFGDDLQNQCREFYKNLQNKISQYNKLKASLAQCYQNIKLSEQKNILDEDGELHLKHTVEIIHALISHQHADKYIHHLRKNYIKLNEIIAEERKLTRTYKKVKIDEVQSCCNKHALQTQQGKVLKDIDTLSQVSNTNNFIFSVQDTCNYAYDPSRYLHRIYVILISENFSKYYHSLVNITDSYKIVYKFLDDIFDKTDKSFLNKSFAKLAIVGQQILRYKLLIDDLIENFHPLITAGMLFRAWDEIPKNLPISPSIPLNKLPTNNSIMDMLYALKDIFLTRNTASNAVLAKKENDRKKSSRLIPVSLMSPQMAKKVPAQRPSSTDTNDTTDSSFASNSDSSSPLSSSSEGEDESGAKRNNDASPIPDVMTSVSNSSLLQMPPAHIKEILKVNLNRNNNINIDQTFQDLQLLDHSDKINFLISYARETNFTSPPLCHIINKLNLNEKIEWIKGSIMRVDDPTSKWNRTGFGLYPFHMEQMLKIKGDDPGLLLPQLLQISREALEFTPSCLNLFYKRFPEVQNFYELVAKITIPMQPIPDTQLSNQ